MNQTPAALYNQPRQLNSMVCDATQGGELELYRQMRTRTPIDGRL
jgi:hypothetical protein